VLARLCLTSLATLLVLALLSGRAEAQGLYYRSIPLGERAIGLGGAYTGIADDPSATYYNPAGLMAGGRFQLLGSLSSIVFSKQKTENAFQVGDENKDLESSHTTTLPHFVGTVVKFGKQAFGDHRYAIAYSSFEVGRERFNVGFTDINPENSADLRLHDDYRMRWWGVSFAAQIKEKLSLGVSSFLSNQSYGYGEDIGFASGGTLEDDGVRVGAESVTSSTGLGIGSWALVFRLGALYRVNRRWQIGVMFQPPGAPLKSDGNIFRRFVADSTTGSSYFLFDQGGLDVRAPIPFELRTGARYKINAVTTLSVDVAVTGPVRDRKVFDVPVELENLDLSIGTYFANSTKRRTTPNAAIGVEHLFGKAVVAGGLFTNISAAPNVPETSTTYAPDQISMYGASLAVGMDTKGYRLTLGATGYFGRGDALSFTVDRAAQVTEYNRSKSNVSALVLYVAGAVSVASKGAKQVQEKYMERKAQKQNGDEEEPDAEADADELVQ
jgi:long-subunit fatty acid transport protein